jgi:hypothetical protein
LKGQQNFDESIKERLAEIHRFLLDIKDGFSASGSLFPHSTMRSLFKQMLQHAQEVISYALKYAKAGGKGKGLSCWLC